MFFYFSLLHLFFIHTVNKKLIACFVMPDGKKFENNFKQLKMDIKVNLSAKKQKSISILVNNFI